MHNNSPITSPLTQNQLKSEIWPKFSKALAGDQLRKEIYLANHSLGRPPDQLEMDIAEGLEYWYQGMDSVWIANGGWSDALNYFRNQVSHLFHLESDAYIMPKNNAGQGLRAVLNSFPIGRTLQVVSTTGEFDSADFILKTYEESGRAKIKWVPPARIDRRVELFDAQMILDSIDLGTDLLVVSHVFFRTGQILDGIGDLILQAKAKGCHVLLDVYHAAGIVPCDLSLLKPDFAVGGCYKYLRGGPGAGFLVISDEILQDPNFNTLDTGWFAKKDPMAFRRDDLPIRGLGSDAWLDSTPPVLLSYQAKSGLDLVLELEVNRIREYSLNQQRFLRDQMRKVGLQPYEPENDEHFGGFSLLPYPSALQIVRKLRQNGVNVDSRNDLIRFSPELLNYNESLIQAAEILGRVINS